MTINAGGYYITACIGSKHSPNGHPGRTITESKKAWNKYVKRQTNCAPSNTVSKTLAAVIERLKQREDRGLAKYGVTCDRTDLSHVEWIQHAQDEAMDFAMYLERLKEWAR